MSILEVLMIVCFGVAWPINLYNSFKSKSTKGILNKLFVSVDAAVYFYILNEAMVLADYILYFVNRHREIQNGICKNYYNVYR